MEHNKAKIIVRNILTEAKRKPKKSKSEDDTLEPEESNINLDNIGSDSGDDTIEPDHSVESNMDIDPKIKSIQNNLQKAFVTAKELGDGKLTRQIANTLTMLMRNQILGGSQQNQNNGSI